MARLNQIIAIEKGIKSRVYSDVGNLHRAIQKPDLFNGFSKSYQDKDEENGEKLPSENKRVQYTVDDVMRSIERMTSEYFDVTARKDWSNCTATADVKVGDTVVVAAAPVTFLLFLEKQLTDLRTVLADLPILDEAENWAKDPNSGYFKSDDIRTHRTRKVQKPLVLYPATAEHPAQTQIMTEDVISGYWTQVKISGAMQKPAKDELMRRAETLLQAVKQAREAANSVDEATAPKVGAAVFGYLFADGGTPTS